MPVVLAKPGSLGSVGITPLHPMTSQLIGSSVLALLGLGFLGAAVAHERRMQANRRPGVTYARATLRWNGGWRRSDLFTEIGLHHQRRASRCGVTGAALLVASILAWMAIGACDAITH